MLEVSVEELQRRAGVHAALGDPVRLAIVDQLATSDRTPGELGRLTGVPSNLLAHHLRVLEQRGLVERRRSIGDGRRAYLRLVTDRPDGPIAPSVPGVGAVLFVCTRNSARSQLAAALWNREARAVRAESAGTHPDVRVHPGAVRAARMRGLDLTREVPRSLHDVTVRRPLVVTVCDQAREELGEQVAIHWSVPDPVAAGTPDAFEVAADEIERRVETLDRVMGPQGAQRRKEVG